MTPIEHAAREVGNRLTARDWDGLRAVLDDDFVDHSAPPETPPGADGYVRVLRWVTEELGIDYITDDVVAGGETAVVRATARGVDVHGGFGFPATGRPFVMATMHWYQGRGGKLTAHWGVLDQLGKLLQVGALPLRPATEPVTAATSTDDSAAEAGRRREHPVTAAMAGTTLRRSAH